MNGDQNLNFGSMKMGTGKAFIIGSLSNSTTVQKNWITNSGRVFLVESVPFTQYFGEGQNSASPPAAARRQYYRHPTNPISRLPGHPSLPPTLAQRTDEPLKLAAENAPQEAGLVMDYDLVDSGEYGELVFSGDTTYAVTGPLLVDDTVTFESGTVVKFTDGSSPDDPIVGIQTVNVVSPSDPYSPAVLTSVDDNSVGEAIGSGSPVTATYNFYLNAGQDGDGNWARFGRIQLEICLCGVGHWRRRMF